MVDKRLPPFGDSLALDVEASQNPIETGKSKEARHVQGRRMEERRRVPRQEVGEEFANLPANMSVRVLDISTAGVLLQSPRMLNPGSRGSLRFTLAGAPFLADVQVRRVTSGSDPGSGYRIGATVIGMSLEHRQLIERFMNND